MKITINNTEIELSPEYDEYIDLMRTAVVKPGDPPVADAAEMVKKILLDTYLANIQQHPSVRPMSVAAKIAEIEKQAGAVFYESAYNAIQ